MKRRLRVMPLLLALLMPVIVAAQPLTCPAIVSEAIAAVGDACGGLGRNEACYGNLTLTATPRDTAKPLAFDAPGDRVNVADIVELELTALTENPSGWGIAIMALQANLPDNLPGQNATVVLFGDVQVENLGEDAPTLPDVFVTGNNVNIRRTPSTSGAVVATLGSMPQQVVGRLADGSWLRLVLADGMDGWVSASVVSVDGDVDALPELAADAPAPTKAYKPMQAFRLRTGLGTPLCSEAPTDGIMIQTPGGAGTVEFEVNGVRIALGSTAVMRTTDDTLRVALVDGQAAITVAHQKGVIRTGRVGIFELDADGEATGEYTVENYTEADVAALPVGLLPDSITVPSPGEAAVSGTPLSGRWQADGKASAQTSCPDVLGFLPDNTSVVVFTVDGDTLTIAEASGALVREADGRWRGDMDGADGYAFRLDAEFTDTTGTGIYTIPADYGSGPCSIIFDMVFTWLGE